MSLNTTPDYLPSTDSNDNWHTSFELRLRSETSTEALYDIWNINDNDWHTSAGGSHSIKVTFSTNSWEDDGGSSPHDVDDTGSTHVVLSSSGNVLYTFLRPTASTASWLSSGGGTSTEEVLVEDARMVYYSGITGWRFEQRGFAAGSYQLIGGTVSESWTVSSGSNNLQHHISQIPAGGTYLLYSGSTVVASLTTTSKKVFCNFW